MPRMRRSPRADAAITFGDATVKWDWLHADHVPRAIGLTRRQRRFIVRRAMRMPNAQRRALIFGTTSAVLFILPFLWLMHFMWQMLRRSSVSLELTIGTLVLVIVSSIFGWVHAVTFGRWSVRPFVLTALREYGYEICPGCGTWLRDMDANQKTCPKCDRTRDPPPCPSCGYPLVLRDATQDRCPECGADLNPADCRACGYSLRGLPDQILNCPE